MNESNGLILAPVRWKVKNFTMAEVACICPICLGYDPKGISNMEPMTMEKFQLARDYLGAPIYGTSWCRCKAHNAHVGGKPDSAHVFTILQRSCAGDVTIVDPKRNFRAMTNYERFLLLDALMKAGFQRLGIHPSFIHADDAPEKVSPRLWIYGEFPV